MYVLNTAHARNQRRNLDLAVRLRSRLCIVMRAAVRRSMEQKDAYNEVTWQGRLRFLTGTPVFKFILRPWLTRLLPCSYIRIGVYHFVAIKRLSCKLTSQENEMHWRVYVISRREVGGIAAYVNWIFGLIHANVVDAHCIRKRQLRQVDCGKILWEAKVGNQVLSADVRVFFLLSTHKNAP